MDNRAASDIAIVIATFRRPHLVTRALDSVAAQTRRPLEIIVVDDASGDHTPDVVEAWAAASAIPVKLIVAERNLGPGAARNRGMQATSASLIGFLDSDDAYHPHALATLLKPLQASSQMVVSFADAVVEWCDGRPVHRHVTSCIAPGQGTQPVEAQAGLYQLVDAQSELLLTSFVPTCSALFRREAAKAVGWMPETRFGEDWLFWLKLTEQGAFVCQFKDVATVHRQGDNLTGTHRDIENAREVLSALLAIRAGEVVTLRPQDLPRLDTAIRQEASQLRYFASRAGWPSYMQALASHEVKSTGGLFGHMLRDPRSVLRALRYSFA